MQWLILFLAVFAMLYAAARFGGSRMQWTVALAAALLLLPLPFWLAVMLWVCYFAVFIPLHFTAVRLKWVSGPLYRYMQGVLPQMSETEKSAMEAGNTWWDADLFSGDPDWKRLHATPKNSLREDEQAFLDGPVSELCDMLDDWQITHKHGDLPPHVWQFIREKRLFGMIIPKSYGGLEFSAYAHSEVIQRIASRSLSASVTVMVPNSLGPAELLLNYGTDAQKDYYLPRLASGEEVPCFALTGPYAGSDAGAMPDRGVVCKGRYSGKTVLGFRVSWAKRYITLGPVATVLGLAFHAFDPDGLLGDADDLGITCALIPTDTKGVKIGRRHYPLNAVFMNGPNWGEDVFVPMEWVIGGEPQIGNGWRMLVERLAVGRGISLPSLSVGAGKLASYSSGAYARVRKQFHLPLGRFEGVEEALARIGGLTYMMDSARRLTLSALDQGERPSVVTAMMKYYLTEGMRQVVNDAMDLHGGKGICMGPSNYLARMYQSVPIGITVEGANILTRTMIIFGQGAMRCHPYILRELEALGDESGEGVAAFDRHFVGHLAYTVRNICRAFVYGVSGGHLAPSPVAGEVAGYYRQLNRFSAAFSAVADMALMVLGGALKRKEHISGRFADALGHMYLCSAILKRFEEDGRPQEDLPLVHWGCQYALWRVQVSLHGIIRHFPFWPLRMKMRVWVFPLGQRLNPPADLLTHQVAALMLTPSATRERLVGGIHRPEDAADPLGALEHALRATLAMEPVERRLQEAGERFVPGAETFQVWVERLLREGLLSRDERKLLLDGWKAVDRVVQVDDFPGPRNRSSKTA